ncbi:MAG: S8 family peptidase [Chitinophagaceae bacterium]|nr:S8 family peptidase [Chitinophagaceae bacterium]
MGLLIFSVTAIAQPQYGFRVSFTDKGGTTQSLSSPLGFLSQRAIDRRATQGIAIDSTDLPVSPDYMDSVLTLTGAKLHLTSRWLNYTVILLTDSSKILTLQSKPFISTIEYMAYYPAGLHKPSKDTDTTGNTLSAAQKTTGSSAYYGDSYSQSALVNGDYLHDIGWKGEGKLIAVLDEGFADVNTAPAFDSMVNAGRLKDHYNFANASTDVFTGGLHGTTSLSTIAGNLPGTYVGAAPHADIALYITEIGGSEQHLEMDNMMAATERADSIGADIITVSLGYNEFNYPDPSYSLKYADIDGKSTIAAKAANIATSKGILFVASAGNEGGGTWNYVLTPGDADSAMTVGSVGLDKVPAPNSGYGPNAAGQVKPDVCMVGQPASIMRNGPNPSFSSGTSWATPQLAGWAACLMQASGNFTPYEIRTAIQKSANLYNNPGLQLGYGVPNFHYALELLNVKELPKVPDANDWIITSPNPFTGSITLRVFNGSKSSLLDIVVTDVSGKIIYQDAVNMSAGVQNIPVTLPGVSNGLYFLKAVTGDKQQVVKLLKN